MESKVFDEKGFQLGLLTLVRIIVTAADAAVIIKNTRITSKTTKTIQLHIVSTSSQKYFLSSLLIDLVIS